MPLRGDNPSAVDLLVDVVDVVQEIVLRRDLDPVTVGVNAPWGGARPPSCCSSEARLAERQDVLCLDGGALAYGGTRPIGTGQPPASMRSMSSSCSLTVPGEP